MVAVARGAKRSIEDGDGTFAIEIRGVPRAAAFDLMSGAVEMLRGLRSPLEDGASALSYCSDPIVLPDGAMIIVDAGDLARAERVALLGMVRRAADEQGVEAGVLDVPQISGSPPLAAPVPASLLWLRPYPAARPVFLAALQWVEDNADSDSEVHLDLGGRDLDLGSPSINEVLSAIDGVAGRTSWAAASYVGSSRWLSVSVARDLTVCVAYGAPPGSAVQPAESAFALRSLGRHLEATVYWAAVEPGRDSGLGTHLMMDTRVSRAHVKGRSGRDQAFVPDAYWWQLLTHRHREGLLQDPTSIDEIGSHHEVTIGAPSDWLSPTEPKRHYQEELAVQVEGRRELEPLFLLAGDLVSVPKDPSPQWSIETGS